MKGMGIMLKRLYKQTRQIDRLDNRLAESLLGSSQYFTKVLGEPARDNSGFLFPVKDGALSSIKVGYEVDNKFLGKVYGMVLDGRVAARGSTRCCSEKAELAYSGIVLKGAPFFKPPKKTSPGKEGLLVQALNRDQHILDMCRSIDAEFLRVFFDYRQEVWRIQMRPYGGSVVALMFPPMRYKVMLPRGHAQVMYAVLKGIASVIQKLQRI